MASSCHATLVTPAGTGMSHRMIPVAIEAVSGPIAAPTGGDLGGSGLAGTGTDGDAAAAALTTSSRRRENVGVWRERGVVLKVWGFREMDLVEWRMDGGDCLGSGRRRREVVSGSVAIETTACWGRMGCVEVEK